MSPKQGVSDPQARLGTRTRSPTAGTVTHSVGTSASRSATPTTHRISPSPNGWLRRTQSPYPLLRPAPQARASDHGASLPGRDPCLSAGSARINSEHHRRLSFVWLAWQQSTMATHAALAASRIPAGARLHSRAASRQVRACRRCCWIDRYEHFRSLIW